MKKNKIKIKKQEKVYKSKHVYAPDGVPQMPNLKEIWSEVTKKKLFITLFKVIRLLLTLLMSSNVTVFLKSKENRVIMVLDTWLMLKNTLYL